MTAPRLFLVAPEASLPQFAACLKAACEAGDVASLLVPTQAAKEWTPLAQELGVAVITRRVVSKEIEMGKLKAIPLSDPAMTRKFYLIHHKDKYLSRPLQGLIEMVDQWADEYSRGEH